jgi:hypothetical protein
MALILLFDVIPIPNEKHSFAGASLATPGLITVRQQRPCISKGRAPATGVRQQRASQAKPLHGSASIGSCSLGKGFTRSLCRNADGRIVASLETQSASGRVFGPSADWGSERSEKPDILRYDGGAQLQLLC